MQLLKDAIAALCREIDTGLSANRTQLQGRALQTERVIFSLQVCLKEHTQTDGSTKPVFEVLSSDSHAANGSYAAAEEPQSHRVTIELKPVAPGGTSQTTAEFEVAQPTPQSPQKPATPATQPVPEAEKVAVTEQLSEVFGEPGFDSSARATVFREAMAGLSDDQARQVMESLRLDLPPKSGNTAVQQAGHRIGNVFRSGPQESELYGAKVLADLLNRYSIASILQLLEEQWKTQDEWMGL